MKRILFLTTYASPYRVAFFDALGRIADVTVLYSDNIEKQTHRSRDWFVSGDGSAHIVQLSKCVATIRKKDLCTDVISWLKKPWDAIILCGYSSPTTMLAMAWLKAHGKRYWLEVDGGLIRPDSRLKHLYKKMLVGSADGWLSTGKATTDFLCHYGARRDRVKVYPFTSLSQADILPRVPTREEKLALRRELGLEGDRVVLSIGQFIHRKGFDVLMKAAAELSEPCEIYIVGGEPTEEYRKLARELGLQNIHFHGFRKKEELAKYYRAADLFVLPTREDIWGLVINEAMAYGLPVITTDRCVAGLELVEEGVSGWIVPAGDEKALAKAMGLALSRDLAPMGAAALQRVAPYTIENMARVHLDIIEGRV